VDGVVEEHVRDWLAPPSRLESPVAIAAPEPSAGLPDTIEALHTLLATGAYAPQPAPPSRRVAASGTSVSDLMIIADMPDPGDAEAGHLFAGETARLFDAMLTAMGRDRTSIYLVPFCPARVAGRIDERQSEALAGLMRRHIALAGPRALILFGDEPARRLIGPEVLQTRGGLRSVKHDGGTVSAIATFHPRHLRRMPTLKAGAWVDMRSLLGVLAQ
jgi:DNA polymerase